MNVSETETLRSQAAQLKKAISETPVWRVLPLWRMEVRLAEIERRLWRLHKENEYFEDENA